MRSFIVCAVLLNILMLIKRRMRRVGIVDGREFTRLTYT